MLVTKVQELKNVGPGKGAASTVLVFEDGSPGNGHVYKDFDLGRLQISVPSQ